MIDNYIIHKCNIKKCTCSGITTSIAYGEYKISIYKRIIRYKNSETNHLRLISKNKGLNGKSYNQKYELNLETRKFGKAHYTIPRICILQTQEGPALPRFTFARSHLDSLDRHCHVFKTTWKTNLYWMQTHHN